MRPLKILTWHVHGNYLWYLSQVPHQFYLPVRDDGRFGYGGRGRTFPFGENVIDIPYDVVGETDFDCILFQAKVHYEQDQYDLLTAAQRELPKVFVEHDPPQEHPTDTVHCVADPSLLVVHVTHFNRLMWDNGRTPTTVIEHGVLVPSEVKYHGEVPKGIVVVNHLLERGRRLGADLFSQARTQVPLDLVGMEAERLGGLGEVSPPELAEFISHYRFFFNPIRYTSFGLAVCEAMMVGLPIIGMATTEYVTAIKNGIHGYLSTDLTQLVPPMRRLLQSADEARQMGDAAREVALRRFSIGRFVDEWNEALTTMVARSPQHAAWALQ